jgi:hypothetical protein
MPIGRDRYGAMSGRRIAALSVTLGSGLGVCFLWAGMSDRRIAALLVTIGIGIGLKVCLFCSAVSGRRIAALLVTLGTGLRDCFLISSYRGCESFVFALPFAVDTQNHGLLQWTDS